ncbi:PTS sugar transporter subunit IIA [Lactobacillus sp. YT155]|uniref:PTS sugar transporter subunit IIA n=1 Tax=Lactobacillus sp. YT155 TaxID=3060955 RepID=UPI00265F847B|nr:PTS sugar transporter subunit IIA [Lactobacillus sp. YT155]MDO1604909.1 PTS sugar transporter subunit IIA [Lactobacillus sp. YT155]
MSELSNLFDKELILFNVEGSTRQNIFEQVSKVLDSNGYTQSTFLDALNKREDEFPTGVVTANLPIALPHANPENVKRPFIAVVQTKNLITVQQMGIGDDEETKNFFFLGIVEETQDLQVKLLQRFMELMNDKEFVNKFKSAADKDSMYDLFMNNF